MLTSTDFDNLDTWVQVWFADADICLNEFICCGVCTKALRFKIAKIYSLWTAIKDVRTRMAEEDPLKLEALYSRLECLINLKVES